MDSSLAQAAEQVAQDNTALEAARAREVAAREELNAANTAVDEAVTTLRDSEKALIEVARA